MIDLPETRMLDHADSFGLNDLTVEEDGAPPRYKALILAVVDEDVATSLTDFCGLV